MAYLEPRGTSGLCEILRYPQSPILIEGTALMRELDKIIHDEQLKARVVEIANRLKIHAVNTLYGGGIAHVLGVIRQSNPRQAARLIDTVIDLGWTAEDLLTKDESEFQKIEDEYVRVPILASVRKFKEVHSL